MPDPPDRFYCFTEASVSSGFHINIPRDVVERCCILHDAVEVADGGEARLVLPAGMGKAAVQYWLRRACSSCVDSDSNQSVSWLLKGIQVADFFADEDTIAHLRRHLAEKMFSTKDDSSVKGKLRDTPVRKKQRTQTNTQPSSMAPQDRFQTKAAEGIIGALPSHLAVGVLQATYPILCRSSKPCIAALARLVMRTSPEYHPLALQAFCQACGSPWQLDLHRYICCDQLHDLQGTPAELAILTTLIHPSLNHLEEFKLHGWWLMAPKHTRHLLPPLFAARTNLRSLTLTDVHWAMLSSPGTQQPYIYLFAHLSSLTSLTLRTDGVPSSCCLVVYGQLLQALPCRHLLKHLDVGGYSPRQPETPLDVVLLCSTFADFPQLETLNLRSCFRCGGEVLRDSMKQDPFGPRKRTRRSKRLMKPMRTPIDAIEILTSDVGELWPSLFPDSIGYTLSQLSTLRHLDLSHCFDSDPIKPILYFCSQLTRLTYFDIGSVSMLLDEEEHVGPAVPCKLAELLGQLTELRHLGLDSWPLHYDSRSNGAAIGRLQHLTFLSLAAQAKAHRFILRGLSPAMPHLTALQELCLAHNAAAMRRRGVVGSIAAGLQALPQLQVLDMSFCGMSRTRVRRLAEGLTGLTALKSLRLVGSGEEMGWRGRAMVLNALAVALKPASAASLAGSVVSFGYFRGPLMERPPPEWSFGWLLQVGVLGFGIPVLPAGHAGGDGESAGSGASTPSPAMSDAEVDDAGEAAGAPVGA